MSPMRATVPMPSRGNASAPREKKSVTAPSSICAMNSSPGSSEKGMPSGQRSVLRSPRRESSTCPPRPRPPLRGDRRGRERAADRRWGGNRPGAFRWPPRPRAGSPGGEAVSPARTPAPRPSHIRSGEGEPRRRDTSPCGIPPNTPGGRFQNYRSRGSPIHPAFERGRRPVETQVLPRRFAATNPRRGNRSPRGTGEACQDSPRRGRRRAAASLSPGRGRQQPFRRYAPSGRPAGGL